MSTAVPLAVKIGPYTVEINRIPWVQLEDAMLEECQGFCMVCGCQTDGCEPDARQYPCPACGQHMVYGAEDIILRGWHT